MSRTCTVVAIILLMLPYSPARGQAPRAATPADQLKVPPGFKAELLHSAKEDEGSWASMTVDDKGRLYVSPQYRSPKEGPGGAKLFRVTLTDGGQVGRIDPVPVEVGGSMGMLWA